MRFGGLGSRRWTPPEYIPRLIAYQLKYEELVKGKEEITLSPVEEEYLKTIRGVEKEVKCILIKEYEVEICKRTIQ